MFDGHEHFAAPISDNESENDDGGVGDGGDDVGGGDDKPQRRRRSLAEAQQNYEMCERCANVQNTDANRIERLFFACSWQAKISELSAACASTRSRAVNIRRDKSEDV